MQRTPNLGLPLAVGGHVELLNTLTEGFGKIAEHLGIELPVEAYGHVAPLESVNRNFEAIEQAMNIKLPRVYAGHVALQQALQSAWDAIDEAAGDGPGPDPVGCPAAWGDVTGLSEPIRTMTLSGQTAMVNLVPEEGENVYAAQSWQSAPIMPGARAKVFGIRLGGDYQGYHTAGIAPANTPAGDIRVLTAGLKFTLWESLSATLTPEVDVDPTWIENDVAPGDILLALMPDGSVRTWVNQVELDAPGTPWAEQGVFATFFATTNTSVGGTKTMELITDAEDLPSGFFPFESEDLCGNEVPGS